MTDATDDSLPRTPTTVDALAERFLLAAADHDPISATVMGLSGHDGRMPDLSPDGVDAETALLRMTLTQLSQAEPIDSVDRVTIAAMTERLGVRVELADLGEPLSRLNNIASPIQNLRDVFDLMPTATEADWSNVSERLRALPSAIDGYVSSLRLAASRGDVVPRRQVLAGIGQCEGFAADGGFFVELVGQAHTSDGPVPDSLLTDLDRRAHAARAGYQQLRDFLADELLSQAPERDGCGTEAYEVHSRQYLGATVDLAETYAWGQDELARIVGLQRETANQIRTGATPAEAIALLDADPKRQLTGTDALRRWMQETSDAAVAALAGTHFDIPGPVRALECRIAPTNSGAIYYTGPSEDFSRPGRMWWSVPAGVTNFSTWRERTTVYHEGVPGHHLQVAQTVYRRELLNSWRRLAAWTSGHGEGWALYAEWLMSDLGFMDDPGDRLGLLDGQSLRAARVVIDIGVHCGFPAPASVGGGNWTYDKAWELLTAHASMAPEILRFELDRYLGWPGQAPSYKVGERLWLQLRDESRTRAGADFDLKSFHRRALDIGSVGLGILRAAVLDEL